MEDSDEPWHSLPYYWVGQLEFSSPICAALHNPIPYGAWQKFKFRGVPTAVTTSWEDPSNQDITTTNIAL